MPVKAPAPTHVGWFLFCPIYARMDDPDCPEVWARHRWLEPLFTFCEWIQGAYITTRTMFDIEYEPGWALVLKPIK